MSQALEYIWPGYPGALAEVEYALSDGDPNFVTAMGLRFAQATLSLRLTQDDTLVFTEAPVEARDDEELVAVGQSSPVWQRCLGCKPSGVWSLTNTNDCAEGLRIAFGDDRPLLELVATSGGIKAFLATQTMDA